MKEVDDCNEVNTEVCRCPTCGATQPWQDECRRCGTELTLLRQLTEEAMELRNDWTIAMSTGDFQKAELIVEQLRTISPTLLCDLLRNYTHHLNKFTSEFFFTS